MDSWVPILAHPCVGDPEPTEDDEWPWHFERHDSAVLPHSNGDGCPRSLGKQECRDLGCLVHPGTGIGTTVGAGLAIRKRGRGFVKGENRWEEVDSRCDGSNG
jgi:hypothetical protein